MSENDVEMDWEQLRWRTLTWSALPHPTRKGSLPFLDAADCLCLDSAMTNREARPHFVEYYRGLQSPGFNGHVYTGTVDEDHNVDHVALRWVMKRGINLRGFEIELKDTRNGYITVKAAGPVLVDLMSEDDVWHDMKIAEYFAARGKLTYLDAQYGAWTALMKASSQGHLDILKALIAAGADKDKDNDYGETPLTRAAMHGHVECAKALLAVKTDVNKADNDGLTPLICASFIGHVEIVKLLLAAGAKKDKITTSGDTALTLATERGHHEIVQLLQQAK